MFAGGPALFEFHCEISLVLVYFPFKTVFFFSYSNQILVRSISLELLIAKGTWGKIPTMRIYFITVEDLNFVLFISQKCVCVCVCVWLSRENNLGSLLTQWYIFYCGLQGPFLSSEASLLTPCPVAALPHRPFLGSLSANYSFPQRCCSCYASCLGMLFPPYVLTPYVHWHSGWLIRTHP